MSPLSNNSQSASARDSGWQTYSGAAWDKRKPMNWLDDWSFWRDCLQEYLPQVTEHTPVLELGCGNGRITQQIALLGYDVVAVDLNPHFLSRAQRYLELGQVDERVKFILADVVTLSLGRKFALALMTDWGFPAILTQSDQLTFFKRLHAHLNPGAVFVFDTIFPTTHQLGLMFDGQQLRWEDGRTFNALTQIETRTSGDFTLRFRHTSLAELHLLASLTGFEIIEQYGNFDRRPLRGVPGDNLTLVMRKLS